MDEKVIKSIERLEKNMIMGFESLRIEIDEKLEKQKEELKTVLAKELKTELAKELKTQLSKELKTELAKELKTQLSKELKAELSKELKKELKELTKNLVTKDELNRRFDEQNKEIAQEFRNIVKYFEDKQKKQEKINQQFYEEFEKNRVSHDGYNSKIYKIELTQSTLERKVLDLEENKKIPV